MNPTEPITTDSGKPCIRGIPLYDIYRTMNWDGLTEDAILQKYPDLKTEDLLTVREYIANSIKSRTTDDFTGRPILAKENLRDGAYYKGRCRNATVARWNAGEQCFFHWRKKFDRIYIQTIKYPTDETDWFLDVFDVVQELANPKFMIPFDMDATFTGNPDDLIEFNVEMWHRPKGCNDVWIRRSFK
jgi:uncharacterized protein (DUF433 family)